MKESITLLLREESVAIFQSKSLFEGFFSQPVPRCNSRRSNQKILDQLEIISKVSKAFYRELSRLGSHM